MKKFLVLLALLATATAHAGQSILLASAARTATTATADQLKTSEGIVAAILNVTAVPGVDTLTLTIQGKDALGNYYTIVSSTASAATGTVMLQAGPGIAVSANVSIANMIPDIYRILVTHSAGTSFTYSVQALTAR